MRELVSGDEDNLIGKAKATEIFLNRQNEDFSDKIGFWLPGV